MTTSKDLSVIHHLVSDFLTMPSTVDQWEQYRLSDEQVEFYREYGYLAGIKILNDDQIKILLSQLSDLMDTAHPQSQLFYELHTNESADPSLTLFHALGAWRIAPAFHDLLWHPAFTVAAAQLLNGPVRFWHDQLFCKPAHHGGVVAWHQDYSYWTRTQPLQHLTCWIGLDDSTIDNGCVHYVSGSHLWPDLPVTGLAGDMDAVESVLSDELKEQFKPVAIELKKGECSFHHPRMMHGSYSNLTDRQRRATVINVFRDGVCSNSDESLLNDVPIIPRGKKIDGQFFPLLLNPEQVGLRL